MPPVSNRAQVCEYADLCHRKSPRWRGLAAAFALLFICYSTHATAAEWTNSLKPAGDPSKAVDITRDGKPLGGIQLPAKPTTIEQKAADDLQHWIAEITGATTPIANDATGAIISINTDPALAPEAYRIDAKDGRLVLTGGPGRGVINAIYALLEEDLGCRFYTNDDIKLPHTPSLSIAVVAREYSPKLMLRDPFYFASFDATWSLRNRTNAPDAKVPEAEGGHIDYGGLFVHTAATLLPADQYANDHPDYFFKNAAGQRSAAQLCPTDPNTIRIVTENVLKTLKAHPETEIVSVSKNDNLGDQICQCDRCVKLREAEGGTDMANQLVLVNHVAEAVEKQYPDVLVDTLAYLETINPPKTMRPRKNVVIRICNDSVGAWNRPFTNARELPVADIIAKWAAIHDKFSIWDYNTNFSHFLAPMPNMDVIADNIRYWVDNHAIGVMTQGGYQSTSERDELRSWVLAKLLWNPELDVDTLVEDFTLGHYGKAGPALMEYEALLKDARRDLAEEFAHPPGGIRYPMTMQFLSKEFLDRADGIFARAEQAALGDEELTKRVERAELPIMYVKLCQAPQRPELIDRFERIARREKVDWILEFSVRLDQRLTEWRAQMLH